ncbi:VWA domain-containing protein [Myxococcota bacterium]|nr:VWA domain-containing protein [Myxococcota bacterium]
MSDTPHDPRLSRWRLVLGGGGDDDGLSPSLTDDELAMDRALEALYDSDRSGGLGSASPKVHRWLADLRRCFPQSAVRVMQRDALERLRLTRLLTEPELLESIEPDPQLVATLLSLRGALPARARDAARQLIGRVVEQLRRRLTEPTRAALRGRRAPGRLKHRPRLSEVNWHRTILKNLRHVQADRRTIIAETLIGQARTSAGLNEVILLVDQSASMAPSVVYASVFAAVLGGLSSVHTRWVAFDTEVADLTDHIHDPVELLLSAQLGGGTDLRRALAYALGQLQRPERTVVVLISDLFDGGDPQRTVDVAAEIVRRGAQLVVLLALSDEGRPAYNPQLAAALAEHGVFAFGCTPDLFPELMSAALRRDDLSLWAARRGVVTARGED